MNLNLPNNLYRKHDRRTGKVYYSYRDLRTGKIHGLGTDKAAAENDANALNALIYSSLRSAKLASLSIPKSDSPPFKRVILRHLELCEKRKLAENTMRNKRSTCKAWEAALGSDTLLDDIDLRKLVETLASYEDRPRMRQNMRSAAIDIWKDAVQEGWAKENLAEKTRSESVKVKRSRLTLENFWKIHAIALKARDTWLARAMELALVSTQRREDISFMEFRQGKDSTAWVDNDVLCVIQKKTGTKLRIPFNVGVAGFTVGGVIKTCRDKVVSRWLVHHHRPRTLSKPGDQVWKDTISRSFARARDLAGVKGENDKTPPTFHEIRSLSIRLYAEGYGPEFAQAMAGHKDPSMTAVYRDVRGSEWLEVKV